MLGPGALAAVRSLTPWQLRNSERRDFVWTREQFIPYHGTSSRHAPRPAAAQVVQTSRLQTSRDQTAPPGAYVDSASAVESLGRCLLHRDAGNTALMKTSWCMTDPKHVRGAAARVRPDFNSRMVHMPGGGIMRREAPYLLSRLASAGFNRKRL